MQIQVIFSCYTKGCPQRNGPGWGLKPSPSLKSGKNLKKTLNLVNSHTHMLALQYGTVDNVISTSVYVYVSTILWQGVLCLFPVSAGKAPVTL